MVFGIVKRIFRKKKKQFEVLISPDNDRIWVNGEEGCVFRLQGLSRTHFTIGYDPMMDIKISSAVLELITEDLIDEQEL